MRLKFKRLTAVLMAVVLVLYLFVPLNIINVLGNDKFIGEWEYVIFNEERTSMPIYIISFYEFNKVTYSAGFYDSEFMYHLTGRYEVSKNNLKLNLNLEDFYTTTPPISNFEITFSFVFNKQKLILTPKTISEDILVFKTGVPLEFTNRDNTMPENISPSSPPEEFVYDVYKNLKTSIDDINVISNVTGKIGNFFDLPEDLLKILTARGITGIDEFSKTMKSVSKISNVQVLNDKIAEFLFLYYSIEQMQNYMDNEKNRYIDISNETVEKIDVIIENISILREFANWAVTLFCIDFVIIESLDNYGKLGWFIKAETILFGWPSQDIINTTNDIYDQVGNQIKNQDYLK